jgi:ribonuclease HI
LAVAALRVGATGAEPVFLAVQRRTTREPSIVRFAIEFGPRCAGPPNSVAPPFEGAIDGPLASSCRDDGVGRRSRAYWGATQRRRTALAKVYAVRIGRQPGIFETWAACEAHVKGFSGAEFKSFVTDDLAQAWLAGDETPGPSTVSAPALSSPSDGAIRIITDGACSGNPGPGGYGVVLVCGAHRKELSQGFLRTANNRMELLAATAGLEALKRPSTGTAVTDSRYLADGVARIERQKANRDLWSQLAALLHTHTVSLEWVKGHDGHAENERCDALARAVIASGNLLEDTGYRT